MDRIKIVVTAEVSQGSILGPTLLWNIYYDELLKTKKPGGVKTIGFVDDLALLVSADSREYLMHRANWALKVAVRVDRTTQVESGAPEN